MVKKKYVQGKKLCILTIAGACLLMSGCGNKKVNYNVENGKTSSTDGGSVGGFDESTKVNENFTVDTKDGEISISIETGIRLPKASTMSVVEVEKIPLTAEYKQKIMKAYFKDGEIYYHDNKHLLKREIERKISENKWKIDLAKEYLNDNDEILQKQSDDANSDIEYLNTIMPQAKDEWTLATEFDSCNEYVAKRNGIVYQIEFVDDGNGNVDSINGCPLYQGETNDGQDYTVVEQYVGPPSLKSQTNRVSRMSDFASGDSYIAGDSNEASISRDEAIEYADNFLKETGGNYHIKRGATDCSWISYRYNSQTQQYEYDDSMRAYWGYLFSYGLGVEDTAFIDSINYEDYVGDTSETDELLTDNYFYQEYTDFTVTDDGVSEFLYQSPVNVTKVSENVSLLSIDSITNILKNELETNPDKYELTDNMTFNMLQLGYIRVRNSSEDNMFSYVPAWMMVGNPYHDSTCLVAVNAIDGTIIDQKDMV